MPSRNIYKDYVADSYYHIYNRGVNRQRIFRNDADYAAFLSLLKRYLSPKPRGAGPAYASYSDQLDLLAFCLMPNLFHLLINNLTEDAMNLLMKGLGVACGM